MIPAARTRGAREMCIIAAAIVLSDLPGSASAQSAPPRIEPVAAAINTALGFRLMTHGGQPTIDACSVRSALPTSQPFPGAVAPEVRVALSDTTATPCDAPPAPAGSWPRTLRVDSVTIETDSTARVAISTRVGEYFFSERYTLYAVFPGYGWSVDSVVTRLTLRITPPRGR